MATEASWDSVYLLGYYDRGGRPHLSSWGGNRPVVAFVVTGVAMHEIPLWAAPVPPSAVVHRVPVDRDPQEYARELNGVRAIGWDMTPEKVERRLC